MDGADLWGLLLPHGTPHPHSRSARLAQTLTNPLPEHATDSDLWRLDRNPRALSIPSSSHRPYRFMSEAGFFDDIFDVPTDDPLLQPEDDDGSSGSARPGEAGSHSSPVPNGSAHRSSGGLFASGPSSRTESPRSGCKAAEGRKAPEGREAPPEPTGRQRPDNLSGDRGRASRDRAVTERKRIEVAPRRRTEGCDLDTVNRALRQDWRIHDIRPFRSDDRTDPVFVVTLERDLPRSLFDFGGVG